MFQDIKINLLYSDLIKDKTFTVLIGPELEFC